MEVKVHFEWGEQGARTLAAVCDALVIVDVLSFSTAVEVAVARGAEVLPFAVRDQLSADAFALQRAAIAAVGRRRVSPERPYSLSPATLRGIPAGTRLVLPSPNGSAISTLAAATQRRLFAGCLRNASAVATATREAGRCIGVVAAGERWPDGSLRPAVEDLIGAGAIIHALASPHQTPEAELAASAFAHCRHDLQAYLCACVSGRELIQGGFPEDVELAAQLDVSAAVPVFRDGAYGRTA